MLARELARFVDLLVISMVGWHLFGSRALEVAALKSPPSWRGNVSNRRGKGVAEEARGRDVGRCPGMVWSVVVQDRFECIARFLRCGKRDDERSAIPRNRMVTA